MVILQFSKAWESAFTPSKPNPDYPGYELRIPQNMYLRKDESIELDLGLFVRIPPGYYGRVGPRLTRGMGLGVLVYTIPCYCNYRLKVTIKALQQNTNIMAGDVVALLTVKKLTEVDLVERADVSDMVNINPAPVVEFCVLVHEAWAPEAIADGYHLKSLCDYVIRPGQQEIIRTGVTFRFPEGFHGVLRTTDAQNWLHNVQLQGDYIPPHTRAEVRFVLQNNDPSRSYVITNGENVAVLSVQRTYPSRLVEVGIDEMGIPTEIQELNVVESKHRSENVTEPPVELNNSSPGKHDREESTSEEESAAEGAEPEQGYSGYNLRKKHKPDCNKAYVFPSFRECFVFNVALIFHNHLPELGVINKIGRELEQEIRKQAELYMECPCQNKESGFTKRSSSCFWASCVKTMADPILTFFISFAGDTLYIRDVHRIELALEDRLKLVCDKQSLSAVYKVSYLESEFQSYL